MVKHQWDDKPAEPKDVSRPASAMVRVKCIVDTRPWTADGPLSRDEEVDVPEDVAKLLEDSNLVERVK